MKGTFGHVERMERIGLPRDFMQESVLIVVEWLCDGKDGLIP